MDFILLFFTTKNNLPRRLCSRHSWCQDGLPELNWQHIKTNGDYWGRGKRPMSTFF